MVAFVGQYLSNRSLQLSRAGPAVLIQNLDVALAFLFGMMFPSEEPT